MQDNYESFKEEYYKLSHVDLSSYKENQMKRRIDNFRRKHAQNSYTQFLETLKNDTELSDTFISYLTINVSEFYRNPTQWDTLRNEIIPKLDKTFSGPIKIWSAACSTGEEPYTLAMIFNELLGVGRFQIIATDLDHEVLQKALKGEYNEKSLKGLPSFYKDKYLKKDENGRYHVNSSIKSLITFKQHNLLKDPYPTGIHLIVCRNVLIYFTEEAKDGIYYKFADALCKKGILFVGSTEQIIGATQYGFTGVQSFFYEKQ